MGKGLFGLDLFKKKVVRELKLYDFAQHGILKGLSTSINYGDYIQISEAVTWVEGTTTTTKAAKKKPTEAEIKELTPKQIYALDTLSIPEMKIVCDKDYLDENIDVLKQKLLLLEPNAPKRAKISRSTRRRLHIAEGWEMGSDNQSGPMKYAYQEMQSMIIRLENRFKFEEYKDKFAVWPYTTSEMIAALLKKYSHLIAEDYTTMIPDLPKDAINQARAYTELCEELCGRKPVFYLIKEKAKSTDTARRRDPILLAQSPFGFFWQTLGAWDEEIKFLEEL